MKLSVGIIIQARMDSRRFPAKVLKQILGRPMAWHVIERCKRFRGCDKVVLATSSRKIDDALIAVANDCEVGIYRGSANDVLDRYYRCAKEYNFDAIVRITADCPLIDSDIGSMVVREFLDSNLAYVRIGNSFPEGLSVEVFSFDAIEQAWKKAELPSEREHVTPYIIKNPIKFPSRTIEHSSDMSSYRFTVDYEDDLRFVTKIYEALYGKNSNFGLNEIFQLFNSRTDIAQLMPVSKRNEGYKRSLQEDKKYLESKKK